MVMHPLSSTSSGPNQQPHLCPCCQASRVKIRTSVHVLYEVVATQAADDLMVVDETIDETGWEAEDEVFCPYCAWTGTVAELGG